MRTEAWFKHKRAANVAFCLKDCRKRGGLQKLQCVTWDSDSESYNLRLNKWLQICSSNYNDLVHAAFLVESGESKHAMIALVSALKKHQPYLPFSPT